MYLGSYQMGAESRLQLSLVLTSWLNGYLPVDAFRDVGYQLVARAP